MGRAHHVSIILENSDAVVDDKRKKCPYPLKDDDFLERSGDMGAESLSIFLRSLTPAPAGC